MKVGDVLDPPGVNARKRIWEIDAGGGATFSVAAADLITEADAAGLTEFASRRKRIIEIGTYTGASTEAILAGMPQDGELWSVDVPTSPENALYTTVTPLWGRMAVYGARLGKNIDRVNLLLCGSERASRLFPDRYFDMIFIDGGHTYSEAISDIRWWFPKLAPGGLFCGHDFDKLVCCLDKSVMLEHAEEEQFDGLHFGVVKAVIEFFEGVDVADHKDSTLWKGNKPRIIRY